jgi:RNA polymerase sigma-70 factor (ECF subfamily)
LQRGLRVLEQSAQGDELSAYHLQAGIAAMHAAAPSFADTDWQALLGLYDQLLATTPSPVVMLNRAIALSMVHGPEPGLASLETLSADPAMKSYYLYPAVRADFLRRLGRNAEAAVCYRQALTRPCTEPERRFLQGRLEMLSGGGSI